MFKSKSDIINRLQQEILPLQGYRSKPVCQNAVTGLEIFQSSFPNGEFPIGAIHEFIPFNADDAASTLGFMTALLSMFSRKNEYLLWISTSRQTFPPAIKSFGIDPSKIIFIDLKNETEVLWVTEEALKCEGISAILAEIPNLDFTSSRRFQLAVESSQVSGFIFRNTSKIPGTTASISRWKIRSLASEIQDLPGVGFPRWQIELVRVRNGRTGCWQLEWRAGRFWQVEQEISILKQLHRKTG